MGQWVIQVSDDDPVATLLCTMYMYLRICSSGLMYFETETQKGSLLL